MGGVFLISERKTIYIPIPTADWLCGGDFLLHILLTTKYRYIMETLFIIVFWCFAFIGMICTIMFVVSLFKGRGDNNGSNNKTATNKTNGVNTAPSNNGGNKKN